MHIAPLQRYNMCRTYDVCNIKHSSPWFVLICTPYFNHAITFNGQMQTKCILVHSYSMIIANFYDIHYFSFIASFLKVRDRNQKYPILQTSLSTYRKNCDDLFPGYEVKPIPDIYKRLYQYYMLQHKKNPFCLSQSAISIRNLIVHFIRSIHQCCAICQDIPYKMCICGREIIKQQ